MRACKHGCESRRIFIGFVLSDARFDWLVENMKLHRALVAQLLSIGCDAGGREFDSDRTNTHGLKITEENVLPL